MSWPERDRFKDYIIVGFYALAFLVIYLFEIEQVIIPDPSDFAYPGWPPSGLIDVIHWWGSEFHEALWERSAWYKATIWVDLLFSGPVYLVGIYAFLMKRTWIRYPAMLQAGILIIIVLISAYAEISGSYAGDRKVVVLASMALWAVIPMLVIRRSIQIGTYSEI